MRAAERLLLLHRQADERVVGRYRGDVGLFQQIDAVGKQEAQRRLRERVEVLRFELTVAHHQRIAIGHEFDRARRFVLEAHAPGLLQVDLAFGAAAVRADLHEVADEVLHAHQIDVHAVDQRALLGIEVCGGPG